MRVYADTSWWPACKCRQDNHHPRAIRLFDREPDAAEFWTPWQRVEVFNGYPGRARRAGVGRGEALQLTRLLEQEARLGYWPHVEFDWTDAVRTACEIGAEHSLKLLFMGTASGITKEPPKLPPHVPPVSPGAKSF